MACSFNIMSYQKKRVVVLVVEIVKQAEYLFSRGGIQVARRLVGKQQRWFENYRTCNGYALALTAGEFIRTMNSAVLKSYSLQHGDCAAVRLVLIQTL
jgi:hypothetical protein